MKASTTRRLRGRSFREGDVRLSRFVNNCAFLILVYQQRVTSFMQRIHPGGKIAPVIKATTVVLVLEAECRFCSWNRDDSKNGQSSGNIQ